MVVREHLGGELEVLKTPFIVFRFLTTFYIYIKTSAILK